MYTGLRRHRNDNSDSVDVHYHWTPNTMQPPAETRGIVLAPLVVLPPENAFEAGHQTSQHRENIVLPRFARCPVPAPAVPFRVRSPSTPHTLRHSARSSLHASAHAGFGSLRSLCGRPWPPARRRSSTQSRHLRCRVVQPASISAGSSHPLRITAAHRPILTKHVKRQSVLRSRPQTSCVR